MQDTVYVIQTYSLQKVNVQLYMCLHEYLVNVTYVLYQAVLISVPDGGESSFSRRGVKNNSIWIGGSVGPRVGVEDLGTESNFDSSVVQPMTLLPYFLHGTGSFLRSNRFSPSQKITRILWNPGVHYRVHNCPSPVPILSHTDPVYAPYSTS
jgi:hypothetical protein